MPRKRRVKAVAVVVRPTAPVQLGRLDPATGKLWLTQDGIAYIFEVSVKTINEHIQHILVKVPETSVNDYRITASDGKRYVKKHYSLETFFHVGMRVKTSMAARRYRRIAARKLAELFMTGKTTSDAEWIGLLTDLFKGGIIRELEPGDEVFAPPKPKALAAPTAAKTATPDGKADRAWQAFNWG